MAVYDSAYLLSQFLRFVGRPPSADANTTASYYQRLSEAQEQVVADIAGIFPDCLYPIVGYNSIPTLTTTDNQTFTFGTDPDGYPLSPMGSVGIYRSLNDIPYSPMEPGVDYIPLGARAIQMPSNQVWSGPLYWRGITPPGAMTASVQPVLFPEASRELITMRAAVNFASEAVRNPPLAALYSGQYGYPLNSNPGRFAFWMLEWRTQFMGGGALGSFTGLQVALGSPTNIGGY